MTSDLPGNEGLLLDVCCVCVLWAALLLRVRPAIRHPHQRIVWLAVSCAAVSMTLGLQPVSAYAATLTGARRTVAIVADLTGVVSAGAFLQFALHVTRERRYTGVIITGAVTVMGTLLTVAGLGSFPCGDYEPPLTFDSVPYATYWLLLLAVHLTACAACVWVCWSYGRRGPHWSVNLGLALLGWGTALAGLFYLTQLVLLAAGSPAGVVPYVLVSLRAALHAAALLVPTVVNLRQVVGHSRTIWRLWPLWRDLIDATPDVALSATRSRALLLLQPRPSRRLIAYRTVIEIQDAVLVLGHYTDSAVSHAAQAHVAGRGVPVEQHDVHVAACVLRRARAAKLSGVPPNAAAVVLATSQETADLATETTFLLELTAAYLSPCARDFEMATDGARAPAEAA